MTVDDDASTVPSTPAIAAGTSTAASSSLEDVNKKGKGRELRKVCLSPPNLN